MSLSSGFEKKIRATDLTIHCVSIKIWQEKENGIKLSGHGTIKTNPLGTLYLEFICTTVEHSINFENSIEKIPKDKSSECERLYGEFISLDGEVLRSDGFSIELSCLNSNKATIMHILLSEIHTPIDLLSAPNENYFYMEFQEEIDIPYNKTNEITSSSTGFKSISRNELEIKLESFCVNITKESDYCFVKARGDFNSEDIEDVIKFYLGFSCGIMVQPYLKHSNIKGESTGLTRICSVDNRLSKKRSSNPIPSNVMTEQGYWQYSEELFKRMASLKSNNNYFFESIYSQWNRVWHGFNGNDAIAELVISVAIEGILNDIYIPKFQENRQDENLKKEIIEIKAKIKKEIKNKDHKNRLINSISYWVKITATKALNILIDEGIISKNDKDSWKDLRNNSAHPKIRNLNKVEEENKKKSFLDCLNTFNKLIANVLGYSGPMHIYAIQKSDIKIINYKNVID